MNSYIKKIGAAALSAMMLATVVPTQVFAENTAKSKVLEMTFENISDNGEDIISMTDERDFKVTLDIDDDMSLEDAKAYAESLEWYLEREKGMQDEKLFKYQYLGGKVEDWKVVKGDEENSDLFTTKTSAIEDDGDLKIEYELSNKLIFGSTTVSLRSIRNCILDYTGDFDLVCKDTKGNIVGEVTVRVNPYDSYRTFSEITEELHEIEDYINTNKSDTMYAEVMSMGKSTMGFDTPYIVIADSKETLNNHLALKEQAEDDPQSVIDKIKSGKLTDYKVPVMYSNVHADETPGADAPMNFAWDLAKNDVIKYDVLSGFTEEGQAQLEKEMEEKDIHWSQLLKDSDGTWWPTGLGSITLDNIKESYWGSNYVSGVIDLEKYYEIENVELNVSDVLDDVFFIVVPEENPDGRTRNNRENINDLDLNRDALFQTRKETQNITKVIAKWNPVTFIELHGFIVAFQIEPCSPPHEPNVEYDVITKVGAFDGKLEEIAKPLKVESVLAGNGNAVVIENDSIEAVKAINSLLDSNNKVGLITKGEYKDNFIVSNELFNKLKDEFIIKGIGVKSIEEAKVIDKPVLYIPGV